MSRLAQFCILFLGFIFCASKPLELDSPLPKEEGSWKQIPGQITLFLGEDAEQEAIHFVAESHEETSPIVLFLDQPAGKEDVEAFLQKCCSYLEQKSISTSAVVAVGKSITAQVQQWLAGNVVESGQNTPNLNGVLFGSPVVQIIHPNKNEEPAVEVKYGFQLPKAQTTRDLRKLWNVALIQRMTEQRIQQQKISTGISRHSSFLLPEKVTIYRMNSLETKNFLHAIQEVKQVGFTIEELSQAKDFFLSKIQQLQNERSSKPATPIASFHAEGFLRNLGLLSYAYYLDSAPNLIESITPIDIAITLNECYDEDKRRITLFANAAEGEQLEMFLRKEIDESEDLKIDNFSPSVATEMEPQNNLDLFYGLPLQDNEREIIYKIIDTMARDNVIKLGLKRKSMERKGKKIRHVHPLRFLGHIFADRHLRHCMREISRSSFKWHGFIDGMKDRVKEEEARGNLYKYVPAFAQIVNGDENKIRHYLEKHDWDGFLRCML